MDRAFEAEMDGHTPPAPPAREPLPVADTLALIQAQARLAGALEIADVAAVLAAITHQDTLQPILDPTAYRAVMGDLRDTETLVRAYLVFRQALEPLRVQARAHANV